MSCLPSDSYMTTMDPNLKLPFQTRSERWQAWIILIVRVIAAQSGPAQSDGSLVLWLSRT